METILSNKHENNMAALGTEILAHFLMSVLAHFAPLWPTFYIKVYPHKEQLYLATFQFNYIVRADFFFTSDCVVN